MPSNIIKWTCILATSLLITACGGSGSTSSPDNGSTVSMQYDMSALLQQSLESDQGGSGVQALAVNVNTASILRGEMSATAIGGENNGQIETFPWTIYLDEDTLEAASNNTIILPPGNYDFELLVTKGDQQYAGYINADIVDGENDLPMTIKPVIGEGILDVTIIDRLAYYKFKYNLDDLDSLSDPTISIRIDAGEEHFFSINPVTGMSNMFLNLPTGNHNLQLKLYDAAIQVGKSITEQESQTVSYGTDLSMDIVPLHGELQFLLTEDGGNANLTVNIPAEIIDEVGGTNNLTSDLALVGIKNPLQESLLYFIQQQDGSYSAEIVLNDLQYEDVTISVVFTDKSTNDQIATCNANWTLNSESQNFNCDITLIRRAVISGNIMAVLGINVSDKDGHPVSGVVITHGDGEVLGITGSGNYGTSGYLKLYMKSGTYQLTATEQSSGNIQTAEVNLTSLEIENIHMVLMEPVPQGFAGDFAESEWEFEGNASYTMSDTSFFINSNGGGGKSATITIAETGTISFDWDIVVYTSGQYGESISYSINGVQNFLSAAGTASGSVSGINVVAGDEFRLSTWGSTQSSSYYASFNNFNFIPD